MKTLLATLVIPVALGLAAPAHADRGPTDASRVPAGAATDNAPFISALRSAGITYGSADQAVTAAKAVCGLANRGESGLAIVSDLKNNNPGFTTDGAAQFAKISAQSFCPQQLAQA